MDAAGAADATAAPHTDGERSTYIYNPWGQLVEIKKFGGGSVTNAKYTYSAMGHRISEQLDTNDSSNTGVGDGLVDAYDPVFFIATDPSGRRLATYRGTDSDPKETFIHHDARVRGPVHQGGPILRDRNAVLAEKVWFWAAEPAEAERYERHYYALDYRGYVAAIFAGDGTLVEQVRYSATGVPFNIPLGDVNADGKVQAGTSGTSDEDQIKAMFIAYHVRGDLDLDGDVDAADLAIAQAKDGTGTGRGFVVLQGATPLTLPIIITLQDLCTKGTSSFTECMACCDNNPLYTDETRGACYQSCATSKFPGDRDTIVVPANGPMDDKQTKCANRCNTFPAVQTPICYGGSIVICQCPGLDAWGQPGRKIEHLPKDAMKCVNFHERVNIEILSCVGIEDGMPPSYTRPDSPWFDSDFRASACNEYHAYIVAASCANGLQCNGTLYEICMCNAAKDALRENWYCRADVYARACSKGEDLGDRGRDREMQKCGDKWDVTLRQRQKSCDSLRR